MLNVVDEFTHGRLAVRVARKLKAMNVIDVLSHLFMSHVGCPATSAPTTGWSSSLKPSRTGSGPRAPRPPPSPRAAPRRTATHENSNARLQDELLNGEIVYTPRDAGNILDR